MGKIDKKRKKLQDRIDTLQEELRVSLTKKDSSTNEMNIPQQQRKIAAAKLVLENFNKMNN